MKFFFKSPFVPVTILRTNRKSYTQEAIPKNQYLSFQNDNKSYSITSNIILILFREDISDSDDVITSYGLEGDKPALTQLILQSPVVQFKLQRNEGNIKSLSTFFLFIIS